MRGRARLPALLLAGGSLALGASAQDFLWTRTDGTRMSARWVGIENPGPGAIFQVQSGNEAHGLRARELVAAHLVGGAVQPAAGSGLRATVLLVGGDRLHGEVRGGEGSGESFTLWSPSLGERAVAVDRVRAILFAALGTELAVEGLRVPEGAKADEAIFRATRRGYDTLLGSIDRFTRSGVIFQVAGASTPQEFPFATILGLALRSGQPSKETLAAHLLTRAGDQVMATPLSVASERLVLQLEGKQQVAVPLGEVSALTIVGEDRTFLSDLEPVEVQENSFYGGTQGTLYPFRKDRSVGGQPLSADGVSYGKGLGVHSRSRLTYVVPPERTRFHALVGYDDETRLLAWQRPRVDVRVHVDGKAVATLLGVRAGDAVQNLGVIAVRPGQKVMLEIDFGPDADHADRIDWLDAVFLR